jgi:hypothetical protein
VLADKGTFTVWLHAAKRLFHVLTTSPRLVVQSRKVGVLPSAARQPLQSLAKYFTFHAKFSLLSLPLRVKRPSSSHFSTLSDLTRTCECPLHSSPPLSTLFVRLLPPSHASRPRHYPQRKACERGRFVRLSHGWASTRLLAGE